MDQPPEAADHRHCCKKQVLDNPVYNKRNSSKEVLMKRAFIFAAGSFFGLRERPVSSDLIIAADAGEQACRQAGLTPHLLLGDFDSMPPPENPEVPLVRLPTEKDDTDTLAAIRTALEQSCDEIYIYGGTGGKRLDHTLANLQALLFIRRHGARGFLYGDHFIWTVIENESLVIPQTVEWGLFSAFCLGNQAEGVDETGFQYPLHDAVLTPDFPLGVSNHIVKPEARITVRKGALAVGWELPPIG
jgi:thiamine pyrophosphokinase